MKTYFMSLPLIALSLFVLYSVNGINVNRQLKSEFAATTPALYQTVKAKTPAKPFRDEHFLDKQLGWGITDHSLWKTTDGGQNWTEIKTSPRVKVLEHYEPQLVIERVQFTDQDNGWVVEGDCLIHTADGGVSWDKQEIKGVIIRSFHFMDSNNGWAVGQLLRLPDKKQEVESWHPVVYATTDGGKTWRNLYIGPEDHYPLWDIWPISSSDIWAVGFAILNSKDGGKSWKKISLEDWGDVRGMPIEIRFINSQTGWMITNEGSVGYLYTDDGGKTWKPRQWTPQNDGLIPWK